MGEISVLVVDDHQVFADALRSRLSMEDDLRPITVAHSAAEALARVQRTPPDVAVVDFVLGDETGAVLCRRIKEICPGSQIVVLSSSPSVDAVVDALIAGASGWLPKMTDVANLIAVIRGVSKGQIWLDPELLGVVMPVLLNRVFSPPHDPLAPLTAREREVLACMIEGLGRTEIAGRLGVSGNTVRTHTTSIIGKLGARTALEAVTLALRAGADDATYPDSGVASRRRPADEWAT